MDGWDGSHIPCYHQTNYYLIIIIFIIYHHPPSSSSLSSCTIVVIICSCSKEYSLLIVAQSKLISFYLSIYCSFCCCFRTKHKDDGMSIKKIWGKSQTEICELIYLGSMYRACTLYPFLF